MPSPISVNMLARRLTTEAHARSKNGHAPHNTIGVASANSSQLMARIPSQ